MYKQLQLYIDINPTHIHHPMKTGLMVKRNRMSDATVRMDSHSMESELN